MESLLQFGLLTIAALLCSACFVVLGDIVKVAWLVPGRHDALPLSFRTAANFFIGLSVFLALFVPLSRVIGARLAMAVIGTAVAGLAFKNAGAWKLDRRAPVQVAAALLLLVLVFTVSNAALWMPPAPPPSFEPLTMSHFGSIHAGRYGNYALFISEFDRVPYLDQNCAQSILGSLLLMLLGGGLLAAIMVWLPVCLAFLAMLIFGIFRVFGHSARLSALAALVVVLGNSAVSTVHVLVLDNGSPIAFMGYSDLILSIGTFLLFALCIVRLSERHGPAIADVGRPIAIFAWTWCWYAPQNLVIAAVACTALMLLSLRQTGARVWMSAAAVFTLSASLGSVQLGTLMPESLREDTGTFAVSFPMSLHFRPYAVYLRSHWTQPRGNLQPEERLFGDRPYEKAVQLGRTVGDDQVFRNVAWFFEDQVWTSLRAYGFPLLGFILASFHFRRSTDAVDRDRERGLLLFSISAFAAGYLIVFSFELAKVKWLLTRFLAPGLAVGMLLLAREMARQLTTTSPLKWKAPAALAVFVALIGPTLEIFTVGYRNFREPSPDPILHRLERALNTPGPMYFDELQLSRGVQRTRGLKILHVPAGQDDRAISTLSFPRPQGTQLIRVRVAEPVQEASDPAFEIIARVNGEPVARRNYVWADLEKRPDGRWALLQVPLEQPAKSFRVELRSLSPHAYDITEFQVTRS